MVQRIKTGIRVEAVPAAFQVWQETRGSLCSSPSLFLALFICSPLSKVVFGLLTGSSNIHTPPCHFSKIKNDIIVPEDESSIKTQLARLVNSVVSGDISKSDEANVSVIEEGDSVSGSLCRGPFTALALHFIGILHLGPSVA